jgi:hypothetical protein
MARRQAEQLNPPLTRAQMSDFVSQVGSAKSNANQEQAKDYNFVSNAYPNLAKQLVGVPASLRTSIFQQIYQGTPIDKIKKALQDYISAGGKGTDGKPDPTIGSVADAQAVLKVLSNLK